MYPRNVRRKKELVVKNISEFSTLKNLKKVDQSYANWNYFSSSSITIFTKYCTLCGWFIFKWRHQNNITDVILVTVFIVNSEHISYLFLMFLLLTLSMNLFAGKLIAKKAGPNMFLLYNEKLHVDLMIEDSLFELVRCLIRCPCRQYS